MNFRCTLRVAAAFCVLACVAGHSFAGLALSDDERDAHISATDLKQRLDKGEHIVILDARSQPTGLMINGAIHVPVSGIEEWAKTADKKTVIVSYCTCPHDEAADSEVEKLRALGFSNAFSLTGGLDAARTAGIAVVEVPE